MNEFLQMIGVTAICYGTMYLIDSILKVRAERLRVEHILKNRATSHTPKDRR